MTRMDAQRRRPSLDGHQVLRFGHDRCGKDCGNACRLSALQKELGHTDVTPGWVDPGGASTDSLHKILEVLWACAKRPLPEGRGRFRVKSAVWRIEQGRDRRMV